MIYLTIQEFFERYPRVAVAVSGGVDSSYLLYAAKKYAEQVKGYYVRSEFQPQFEWEDAMRLAKELDAEVETVSLNVLSIPDVRRNPTDRCYYCKRAIFTEIAQRAAEDGYTVLLDGTNASDDAGDRPGMRALAELSVLSPLRECGLTKRRIRELSREAGLFTWDKPAYACLATRIETGEEITPEKLTATETAESFLFSIGFSDLRVRASNGNARIQVPSDQIERLIAYRERILAELLKYYRTVSLDLEVRK